VRIRAVNELAHAARPSGRRPSRPLLKVLGATVGVAAAIGGTIGTGILRAPGPVAALVPNGAWLFVMWLAGGIFVLLCINSFAELATALPRAGGPYVYVRRAFGPYAGFAVGWGDWAIQIAGIGFLAVSIGDFVARLVPALQGFAHLIACGSIVLLGALHWFGLRAGERAQDVMSLLKVLAFGVLVAAFYFAPAHPLAPARTVTHAGSALVFVPLVLGLQLIYETYAGWYAGLYFAEEDRDPGRNVPRALYVSAATVLLVYLLINGGLLRVLGVEGLAGSQLAVADAASIIFGGRSDEVVTAVAIVSLVGILNIYLMLAPRILYALSRDGLLTAAASQVGVRGTPQVALIITIVAALPVTAAVSFDNLFALTAFLTLGVDGVVLIALFALRRSEPALERPYRAWGYPWLPGIAVLGSLALLLGFVLSNPVNSAWAVLILVLSYPAYRWIGRRRNDV
jgi:APA family basic amino acid/polyamine antiporter